MRLWSLHPKYLDGKGLVALWREALLAQKVLRGETRGYKNHPQLERFKGNENLIGYYLSHVFWAGVDRGYRFKHEKIINPIPLLKMIPVTKGQLKFELIHLLAKLRVRNKKKFVANMLMGVAQIEPHPMFYVVDGDIESWEKGAQNASTSTGSN